MVNVWLHSTSDASPRHPNAAAALGAPAPAALLLLQILPVLPPHRANHARRGPRFSVGRALPAGRLARLGATPDFHHGLLDGFTRSVVVLAVLSGAALDPRPQGGGLSLCRAGRVIGCCMAARHRVPASGLEQEVRADSPPVTSLLRRNHLGDAANARVACIQVVLLVHDQVAGFDELTAPYTHSVADRTEHLAVPVQLQELAVLTGRHPRL